MKTDYNNDYQIVVPKDETRFYYSLDPGVYLFESDNSNGYYTWSYQYDAGQLLITSGQTTTHSIVQ